ncbi:pirin family protein [Paenibacillus gansuensis]|uniref:Pirin family protein n=1 Tax=Paenibacillus gansuensis TaxID=306542 RepID=A0ABW5PA29_9BACL
MTIKVYSPNQQVLEAYDRGKIDVQKPIGFPHQDSVVRRVGPLFYWSWAYTKTEGGIGLHPHQGFEIMTYVINGQLTHGDTLGTKSTVGTGGVQVMQTGSGVSHEESVKGPDAEMFQIWLEPHLSQALKRVPTYAEYQNEHFPVSSPAQGVHVKTLIGEGAPIHLVTDAKMWDMTVEPGRAHEQVVPAGFSWAALAIRGNGSWMDVSAGSESSSVPFVHRDFNVIDAGGTDKRIKLRNDADAPLRVFMIEVPTTVDYPLYNKGR